MHVLTEADVHRLLDPRALIPAIEEAFRSRYSSTLMPTRTQMKVGDGVFLIMPCYDSVGHGLGMKMVKFNESPSLAEERVQATYILLEVESGCAKLVIIRKLISQSNQGRVRVAGCNGIRWHCFAGNQFLA